MTGDLISRDALKNLTCGIIDEDGNIHQVVMLADIDNVPTVELFCSYLSDGEVKQPCVEGPCTVCDANMKGEWARHDKWVGGEYVGGFYHVNCPCEDGYYSKWRYNFCPNCGAPMQKGDAE